MVRSTDLKRRRYETTIANFERWLDYLRKRPEQSPEVLEVIAYLETAAEFERRKLAQYLERRERG